MSYEAGASQVGTRRRRRRKRDKRPSTLDMMDQKHVFNKMSPRTVYWSRNNTGRLKQQIFGEHS